ncbi:MAG: DHH family phosphoesterase [Clostridia bacterium]|nr:DHH family phosphoesterase [Clostridia bacterium]
MKIDFATLLDRVLELDDVVILIHHFPDGDTIGSGFALCRCLQKMGRRAKVECSHTIPKRYDYIVNSVEQKEFEPKCVIAVDTADFLLLGDKLKKYEGKVELCIDHHGSNLLFAKETYVDPTAAATCEIINDIICHISRMDDQMAAALYTGIATDTGCFKFSNATARTHIIAAELIQLGIDSGEINRIMFDTKSKSRVMIEKMAMENMIFTAEDKCALICITKKMREMSDAKDDELEGITALPRQIEGVIIGITMRERENDTYKISVRTHEPIDASAFCAKFGGGGHIRAGGCEIKGKYDDVAKLLLSEAEKVIASER